MIRTRFWVSPSLLVLSLGLSLRLDSQPQAVSFLIADAQLADGMGSPLGRANVRVSRGRIAEIGDIHPQKNEPTIDAKGLVLAPGFIDIQNHSEEGLPNDPLAETQIAQGITTVIAGGDGHSPWPLIEWVRKIQLLHTSLNFAVFAGHATIREQVLGKDDQRVARPEEIGRMQQLLGQAMNQQALGLSSGLEYDPGSDSSTEELLALAKVAAERGGFYMTHTRAEAEKSFEALNEEISIGERAHIPIEHSHITRGARDRSASYIRVIEDARKRGIDFLADGDPYDAWYSNLKALVPDKQYENPKRVEKALADVGGASRITITQFKPNSGYPGHTLADLAASAHLSEVEMLVRLVREGDAAGAEAVVLCQSMTESDMKIFYQQPWVMVASDGGIASDHPRGAGTFPRVLGRYVREKHWLALPEAIRKMTSLPAERLNWKDRGVVRVGAFADLVLFSPDTIRDKSTYSHPTALPTGIEKVFVNGVLVWDHGKPTAARPGLFLGQGGSPMPLLD